MQQHSELSELRQNGRGDGLAKEGKLDAYCTSGSSPPAPKKTKRTERHESEFYATPRWTVHRLLEALHLPGGNWLEPGAGEGDLIRAVAEKRDDVRWTALELRPECKPHLDKLKPRPEIIITDKFIGAPEPEKPLRGHRFDVAFGNPPFSLAIEFIRECFEVADRVVFLLRLNFLATSSRSTFMRTYCPDIYILPQRPSFNGTGTDAQEYAWFVWGPPVGRRRNTGIVRVLADTDKKTRLATSHGIYTPQGYIRG